MVLEVIEEKSVPEIATTDVMLDMVVEDEVDEDDVQELDSAVVDSDKVMVATPQVCLASILTTVIATSAYWMPASASKPYLTVRAARWNLACPWLECNQPLIQNLQCFA